MYYLLIDSLKRIVENIQDGRAVGQNEVKLFSVEDVYFFRLLARSWRHLHSVKSHLSVHFAVGILGTDSLSSFHS